MKFQQLRASNSYIATSRINSDTKSNVSNADSMLHEKILPSVVFVRAMWEVTFV
jgi:hypothetical protein